MLTRILPRAAIVTGLVAAGLGLLTVPAHADYVVCPPLGGACYVVVTTPGSPGGGSDAGGGGGGGGGRTCTWANHTVPCTHEMADGIGWFNSTDGCYYFRTDPPPPAGSPLWQGHEVGDGWVYAMICYPPDGIDPLGFAGVTMRWLQNPPPGFSGGPSPAELAAQAINRLPIRGPQIGIAPDESGAGLVGLPVWLWTAVTPETWGPISATASVPGLSVTATAQATQIEWQMGDEKSVVCRNPGTAYEDRYGATASPTCHYRYREPSDAKPGGRYTVTGITTWHVTWAGGGQSGTLDVTRQSSTTIDINELEVLTS